MRGCVDWFPSPFTNINRKLGAIMAQLDDLQAALTGISDKVDDVDTKLDGVRASIMTVDQEVKDLIALLAAGPTDLTAAIAQAQAISGHLDAVGGEVQTAQDALGAIPPKP